MATWRNIPQHDVAVHPLAPIRNMPAHVPKIRVALTDARVGDHNVEGAVEDFGVRLEIASHAPIIDDLENIKLRS
jgi:hypothetical protein